MMPESTLTKLAISAGLAALLSGCGPGTSGLTLSVTPHAHPVLIRNDRNVLQQVSVKSARSAPVDLQSMDFALDGTTDLNDVDSLELLWSGAKPDLETATRFGDAVSPVAKVSFHGSHSVAPGDNILLLSVKLKPGADLSHKVAAKLLSAGVNGGSLQPQAPPVETRRIGLALRKHNDDGVHTYRIPSLAAGPNGTLYSVYDMRRRKSRDLQEDIDIGLSRSTDGGRTWEPVRVIMDM